MSKTTEFTGKALYGLTFVVFLPLGLIIWAHFTEYLFDIPSIDDPVLGWILTSSGGLLMLWGMLFLVIYGKGMPMNAYPPSHFVTNGPYRIVHHPIYVGFTIGMLGVFVLIGSASGIWLVIPVLATGIIALLAGYESDMLKERFPDQSLSPVFRLPDVSDSAAVLKERLSAVSLIFLFHILSNLILENFAQKIEPAIGGAFSAFRFAVKPIFLWLIFISLYAVPFLIHQKNDLRQWIIASAIGLSISSYTGLLIPACGAQFLHADGSAIVSVPVFLFFISSYYLWKSSRLKGLWLAYYGILCPSIMLMNSRSALLNILLGIPIFLVSVNISGLWKFLRLAAERIANSWKEWTFGQVRIINHGFYVGFAAFLGILLSGILAGADYAWSILVFGVIVIVFSAIWAQVIEGSEKLKRPFGYYGALVGIIFASLAVWAMGSNVWVLIGTISVSMPWVQGIGRLRCLVNGCCHGKSTGNPKIGIRYFHFRSRVCNISELKGKLLHPTPLYAIIWLFLVGFILLACWNWHLPPPFIFGMYLILTGTGRFVEEAYRGEVQTPFLKGLRLYQWTAILSVLIGIVLTTVRAEAVFTSPDMNPDILIAAFIGGLFTFIAMGVDFPGSNARFSRLV